MDRARIPALTAGIGLATFVLVAAIAPAEGSPDRAVLGLILISAMILSYRFPIQIERDTRIAMETAPLFLLCALLPPALAIPSVALGKLGGEFLVRREVDTYISDIVTQVGRWLTIAAAVSLIAHLSLAGSLHGFQLVLAAAVLWSGEMLTAPLLLAGFGAHPLRVVTTVVREAGSIEAAQNLIGVLGALASLQAHWAVVLVILPGVMMYTTFKRARDMNVRARDLLASVVETTASGAILLLDTRGSIMTANGQAALLYGYDEPQDLVGLSITALIHDRDQDRVIGDLHEAVDGVVRGGEYTMRRLDGLSFAGEVNWSVITGANGRARGITFVARDVTVRRNAEEEMVRRALHDPLTGLPNRAHYTTLVDQAVAHALRDGTPCAVALIDLDRFKEINDTYGHRAGDQLLVEVAMRLRTALRESDTVARLGGDEFALLLPHADREGAALVASRLTTVVHLPIDLGGARTEVGMSIGIALVGEDGADSATLLHHADLAMYDAKRHRRGFAFHREDSTPAAG